MTQSNKQDLGTLVKLEGKEAVRYERVYPHATDRVWRALIEPASLKAWFPTTIDGLAQAANEKRTKAELTFKFEGDDGPELTGELRACDPPRMLEYTWGDDLLRFELSEAGPSGKHTKLVFTTTFGERSQASRDATGWHICLDNLSRNLEGEEPQPAGEQLTELNAAYRESLGGDFPSFLKGASADDLARELPAQGLEGQLFKSESGVSVVLVRASRATEITHRDLPRGGYLSVIEGAFELHLGGHQMRFTPGMEFHIPEGAHVRGRMAEGTRILFAAPPQ
jgi:uncharacterized protein YndB with AHSA1/START domain